MDITGMSGYTNYLVDANKSSTDALEKKLNAVTDAEAEDEELLEACKQFESYLWEQIMKGMEKTVKLFDDDKEEGYASNMVDTFKDTMFQELATQLTSEGASGPNSLAQMLYEQMKRNQEAVEL